MRLALLLSFTFLFASHYASAQWQAIESPAGAEIRMFEQSGTRTFAATFTGLYYSDDEGNQWTNAFSGEYERGFVNVIQTAGPVVICRIRSLDTGDYHIFMSENNGDDWSDFPVPPSAGNNYSSLFFNGQIIIYQVYDVLFVSTDL